MLDLKVRNNEKEGNVETKILIQGEKDEVLAEFGYLFKKIVQQCEGISIEDLKTSLVVADLFSGKDEEN